MAHILVAGGLGYIGSCVAVDLIKDGHDIVIVDNLVNSTTQVLNRISEVSGQKSIKFLITDIANSTCVNQIYRKYGKFDYIFHFAALKSVPDSISSPIEYYKNNLMSTINLCHLATKAESSIIFSSSCTVYGDGNPPFSVISPTKESPSPYGQSKQMSEQIIWKCSSLGVRSVNLRYFNPMGAHKSGKLGNNCLHDKNVVEILCECAYYDKPFTIFGEDWNTPDGTCIRDYIDINDLSKAHILAMKYLKDNPNDICRNFNVGTGSGVSVRDLVDEFKKSNKIDFPVVARGRRPGDVESAYASTDEISIVPGFKCEVPLSESLKSAYKWYKSCL